MGGQQQRSPQSQPCGHPPSWHLGVPCSVSSTGLGSAAVQPWLILAGAGVPGGDDSLTDCSVVAKAAEGGIPYQP